MSNIDRAVDFTNTYLSIVEERFHFKWNDNGDPFCIPSELNVFSLQRVKNELSELLKDSLKDNAIIDSRAFGQQNIQTVGFGLVPDFDRFVKMGFLCGNRLVLWDFLATRGLAEIDDSDNGKTLLASIASNLLLLKPIIEKGGLVLLPHPTDWSDKARFHINELGQTHEFNTTNFGLVSTLSILDEIPMHPYTLFPDQTIKWPRHPEGINDHEYFSKEHYAFHKVINNLFDDRRFNFLNNVRANEFYNIINSEKSFYTELHNLLSAPISNSSSQQLQKHSSDSISKLFELLDKRNKRIAANVTNNASASLAVMAGIGTLLNSTALATAATPIGAGLAIIGLSASLFRYLSNHFKKENESVLVQAFYNLQQATFYEDTNEGE